MQSRRSPVLARDAKAKFWSEKKQEKIETIETIETLAKPSQPSQPIKNR